MTGGKIMRRTCAIAVMTVLGPPGLREVGAQAGLLVPTSTGRADAAVLSLREMAIDVGIARGYARVNVRQVYENHTGDVQEGSYRFALPPSAAVGDFAVWDGLVRIPGVILEKRRARAIYRDLTTQRRLDRLDVVKTDALALQEAGIVDQIVIEAARDERGQSHHVCQLDQCRREIISGHLPLSALPGRDCSPAWGQRLTLPGYIRRGNAARAGIVRRG